MNIIANRQPNPTINDIRPRLFFESFFENATYQKVIKLISVIIASIFIII